MNIAEEYFTLLIQFIAGGQIHHIVLEIMLIMWVLWLICKKNDKYELNLTEREKETMIRDYSPEPLVAEVPPTHYALNPKIVNGKAGMYVNIDGIDCLNFATHNYLSFIGNERIEGKAMKSISKYGVGSCGPRGFYGTSEVHLELEKCLAQFMDTEDAVLYSYGFSTVASAIPAYAKKGDMIFADEKVNFAIQKGLDASRSMIKYFKHNDVDDLHRLLEKTRQEDAKNVKKASRSRRFLVVEGIYANTGEICPLPKLIELRKKYKLRIFIDESISFGVLGDNGRGVTEYFATPKDDVDLVIGSLEHSLASIGGFCVGSSFIVDHQRLSGLGYCFSASLPPLLVVAAMESLKCIDEKPEMLRNLRRLCHTMHDRLMSSSLIQNYFTISGARDSPVHLLFLRSNFQNCIDKQLTIQDIIDKCFLDHIAVSRASYLDNVDKSLPTECLRITVSVSHSEKTIDQLIQSLESTIVVDRPPPRLRSSRPGTWHNRTDLYQNPVDCSLESCVIFSIRFQTCFNLAYCCVKVLN